MKTLLSVILLIALAPFAAAAGEEDGDEAMPGLIPASGILIFYKSEGALSFVTMTPQDRTTAPTTLVRSPAVDGGSEERRVGKECRSRGSPCH